MRSPSHDFEGSPIPAARGGTLNRVSAMKDDSPRAPLIVVSGPSGVGKTTVVEKLITQSKLPLRRAITATTREKRLGEEDGKSYHFWNPEQFRLAVENVEMVEWEIVHGKDYYGIPREEVDRYRAKGIGVILVIDVKGAASIRALYPNDHVSVFINAPFAELEARLRARGAESEERIQQRLNTAREEIGRADEFNHTVINRELDRAVAELEQIIEMQFTKPR
jgi:guanylate kinase